MTCGFPSQLKMFTSHDIIIHNSKHSPCVMAPVDIIVDLTTQISKFCRPQVGPMLAIWTLLSGKLTFS